MMARLDRDTRRTTLLLRDTQAEFYAQGSIAWAKDQLRTNLEKKKENQLVDVTPIKSPVNQVNGYKIVSTIYDMQARYNINNLINVENQADFIHLLQTVYPKLTAENAQEMSLAIMQWIRPGGDSENVFSTYYASLPTPYRAAHRLMISPSELRLVKGMTAELYRALQPYVTTLPEATQINIQAAPAPVMVTLSSSMTLDAAKQIEAIRAQNPIASNQAFLELDVVKNHQVESGKIVMPSNYFLVETEVIIEKQHVVLYTLLFRTAKDNKPAVITLWQSKGVW